MSANIANINWEVETSTQYKTLEPGNYVSRIVKVIDLGHQWIEPFTELNQKGEINEPKWEKTLLFFFEFPTENRLEGEGFEAHLLPKEVKNFFSSEKSTNKSHLTRMFTALNKKDKNIISTLGELLQVQVGLTSGGKPKIVEFSSLSKEQKKIIEANPEEYKQYNENEWLFLHPDYFDFEVFLKQPDWVQKKIIASKEWQQNTNWEEMREALENPVTQTEKEVF